jgi:hypothetical protein
MVLASTQAETANECANHYGQASADMHKCAHLHVPHGFERLWNEYGMPRLGKAAA